MDLYGGCSITVVHAVVVRRERVRFPPSALISSSFRKPIKICIYTSFTLYYNGGKEMNKKGVGSWLAWAIFFLIVAIVAAIFGFGLISGVSFEIAKWLAIIFVVLFIITIIARTIKRA